MPTFILPTKEQLQSYATSPAQLVRDAEVENFLTNVDHYVFLVTLNEKWRAGETSFSYATDSHNADKLFEYLTSTKYGYNYNCSLSPSTNGAKTLSVSWA